MCVYVNIYIYMHVYVPWEHISIYTCIHGHIYVYMVKVIEGCRVILGKSFRVQMRAKEKTVGNPI